MKNFSKLLVGAILLASLSLNFYFFSGDSKSKPKECVNVPQKIEVANNLAKVSKFKDAALSVQFVKSYISEEHIYLQFLSRGSIDISTLSLKVQPEISDMKVQVSGEYVILLGKIRAGQKYRVSVAKGLKDSNGNKLLDDVVSEVSVPDIPADVQFATFGKYLPLKGKRLVLPYCIQNCKRFTVNIAKAYENNLNPFYDLPWRADNLMVDIAEKTFEIAAPKNERIFGELDIESLLKGRKAGVYKITLSSPDIVYDWNKGKDSRTVIITDIAMQAVSDPNSDQTFVFLRSLSDAKPVADAEVVLLSLKNQTIARAISNANGIAELKYDVSWNRDGDDPIAVVAKKGEDISYFRLEDSHEFTKGGNVFRSNSPRAFVFAERGICRPGEDFQTSVFLRKYGHSTFLPMGDAPVEISVYTPDNKRFAVASKNVDESGFASFTFKTPRSAKIGEYRIVCRAIGEKESCGETKIQIASFVPDRLKVRGHLESECLNNESKILFAFDAEYYFGAPLERGVFTYNIVAVPAQRPKHWDSSWTYGARDLFDSGKEISERIAKNSAGTENVEYAGLKKSGVRAFEPVEVVATGTFAEEGGRGTTNIQSAIVNPSKWYIGLRKTKMNILDEAVFEYTALPAEKDVPAKIKDTLKFEIIRLEWNYVLVKDSLGYYKREWTLQKIDNVKFAEAKFDSDKKGIGKVSFTLPAGEYELRASCGDSIISILQFAHYRGEGSLSSNPNAIRFKTDSDIYKAGDTATVKFDCLQKGEVFVVCGENFADAHFAQKTVSGENTVKIKIPEHVDSSAYFAGFTIVSQNGDESTRSFGILKLKLDQNARHRLNVKLLLPENAEPNSEIEAVLKLSDGSGNPVSGTVLLYAVDAGVISITDYKTPDIYSRFFGDNICPFVFFDMYGLIYNNLKITADGRIGGDITRKLGKLKQKDTARILCGTQKIGSDGKISMKIRLPEHLGALDFFAVGSSENAVGSTKVQMAIKNNVTVAISAPRFIAPNDVAEISVSIFNNNSDSSDCECSISLPEYLKALDGEKLNFSASGVKRGFQKNFKIRVRAEGDAQTGKVSANVKFGADTSRDWTYINLRSPNASRTQSQFSALATDGQMSLSQKTNDEYIGEVSREIRILSSPTCAVADALEWLNTYPYGCLEQKTATAFPYVYTSSLVKSGIIDTALASTHSNKIAAIYSDILSHSLSDGSFSMWRGGNEAWNEASIFALHFIFEAESAKLLSVSENDRTRFLKFLRTMADNASPDAENMRAYAVYVLAVAKDESFVSCARNIVANLESANWSAFMAGAALVRGGYAAAGTPAMREALNNKCWLTDGVPVSYCGMAGALGATLRTMLDCNYKDDALATALANELVKEIRDDGDVWGTTANNVWATLGLVAFAEKYPSGEAEVEISDGNGTRKIKISKPQKIIPAGDFKIRNISKNFVFVETRITGIPKKSEPQEGYFGIKKTLINADGEPISEAKHGEEVYVRINFETPYAVKNIAIADLLPAGLEIEDEKFAGGFAAIPNSQNSESGLVGGALENRDDRVLFFGDAVGNAQFIYKTRAVIRGEFYIPQCTAEAMYNPDLKGCSGSLGKFTVK